MTASSFTPWFTWMERNFEGQALHDTPGDPGGDTAYGWTYATWEGFAKLHGLDSSFDHFKTMTLDDFSLPSRLAFWNAVKADQLPPGMDVIWADFQFGSFRATEVLQTILGVTPDNSVGPETIQAAWAVNNRATFLQQMTSARRSYYKTLSTYAEFGNGWDRRAVECLGLAQQISGFTVAQTTTNPQVSANTSVSTDDSADALMAAEQKQLDQGTQT